MVPEALDQLAQQLVPGGVSVYVVDLLQAIDIDVSGYELMARSPRAIYLPLEIYESDPAPAGAGQVVRPRLPPVARGVLAVPPGLLAVLPCMHSVARRVLAIVPRLPSGLP